MRSIDPREATAILRGAAEREFRGLRFPAVPAGPAIRNLRLVGCDLSEVTYKGRLMGRGLIADCHFERVTFGAVDIRKYTIERTTFDACRLGGYLSDVRFHTSSLQDCRLSQLDVRAMSLVDTVIDGVQMVDVTWDGGTIERSRMAGTLRNANLRSIRADEADLRQLHTTLTELVRWEGRVSLPQFVDSFVVMTDVARAVVPSLRETIGGAAVDIAMRILDSHGSYPAVMDDDFFQQEGPAFGGISPSESDAILAALFPHRLSELLSSA